MKTSDDSFTMLDALLGNIDKVDITYMSSVEAESLLSMLNSLYDSFAYAALVSPTMAYKVHRAIDIVETKMCEKDMKGIH